PVSHGRRHLDPSVLSGAGAAPDDVSPDALGALSGSQRRRHRPSPRGHPGGMSLRSSTLG
ncbi:MAG: hypothetical protein MUP76_02015, partial [Acidimicrobiia bacterium]|nr:hypothetical protein [Acidimicrobiia bacterium]